MASSLFQQLQAHLQTLEVPRHTASDIHQDDLFRGKRMFEYWLCRHYDPQSEAFTGADSLLTLLDLGWQPVEVVIRQQLPMMGGCSCCYHFQLEREDSDLAWDAEGSTDAPDTVSLCIVYNPAVERIIARLGLQIVHHDALLDEVRAHLLPPRPSGV